MKNKINCPLMEDFIDEGTCFDIHMVIEDGAPKWTAPEKAMNNLNFKEICLKCPNHRED